MYRGIRKVECETHREAAREASPVIVQALSHSDLRPIYSPFCHGPVTPVMSLHVTLATPIPAPFGFESFATRPHSMPTNPGNIDGNAPSPPAPRLTHDVSETRPFTVKNREDIERGSSPPPVHSPEKPALPRLSYHLPPLH